MSQFQNRRPTIYTHLQFEGLLTDEDSVFDVPRQKPFCICLDLVGICYGTSSYIERLQPQSTPDPHHPNELYLFAICIIICLART